MHLLDAASRDITEGSQVQVSNLRGHCLAGGSITDGVTRGVVLMATEAWFEPGFGANGIKLNNPVTQMY